MVWRSPACAAGFVQVVYDHPERFRLDKPLTDGAVDELVRLSTDFLQQKDSPSLETVCMQVAFDSSYFRNHTELETAASNKRQRLQDIEAEVCSASPASANDFNAMTQVYHQVCALVCCVLVRHAPTRCGCADLTDHRPSHATRPDPTQPNPTQQTLHHRFSSTSQPTPTWTRRRGATMKCCAKSRRPSSQSSPAWA